jgi:hypothetical protein
MKRQRRQIEGASLAFLDVISCGFGALILLLVLTKVFEPVPIDVDKLESYLALLQEQVFDLRGETRNLNREMIRKEDRQDVEVKRLTQLQRNMQALKNQLDTTSDTTNVNNTIEGRLAKAQQTLTEEMRRLLAEYQKRAEDDTIGGIPVDSEYVIFIIDTSGSMQQFAWPRLLQQVEETLAVYPKLKGIQVMNDMGNFMFSQYVNEWIPDTQARRKRILEKLGNWKPFSNSNPTEGITKAISTFYRPDRKISLFVLGDEFAGNSIQRVLSQVARINRVGKEGKRLVRIHAIGFPVMYAQRVQFQRTGILFAMLMRELCAQNGGTFVALNDFRVL